jgi:hypothetical protein
LEAHETKPTGLVEILEGAKAVAEATSRKDVAQENFMVNYAQRKGIS